MPTVLESFRLFRRAKAWKKFVEDTIQIHYDRVSRLEHALERSEHKLADREQAANVVAKRVLELEHALERSEHKLADREQAANVVAKRVLELEHALERSEHKLADREQAANVVAKRVLELEHALERLEGELVAAHQQRVDALVNRSFAQRFEMHVVRSAPGMAQLLAQSEKVLLGRRASELLILPLEKSEAKAWPLVGLSPMDVIEAVIAGTLDRARIIGKPHP